MSAIQPPKESSPTENRLAMQATTGPVVSSREVLRGQQELQINHCGAVYTLRVTRQGKLILTK